LSLVNQIRKVKLHTFDLPVYFFNLQVEVLIRSFSLLLQDQDLFFEQVVDFVELVFVFRIGFIKPSEHVVKLLIKILKLLAVIFVT
jgi:hypothetical protein